MMDEMDDDVSTRVSFFKRIELKYLETVKKKNEFIKKEKLTQFHKLRIELQHLLKHNESVDELEKLDKDEFIVNLEEQARLEKEGDDRALAVEKRILSENATRKLIFKRLMNELWLSMEHKGKDIFSIHTNVKVSNFPVPVVTEERQYIYERAFMHRRIELREIQQSYRSNVWPGVCEETNSGVQMSWMVNEGKLAPDPDVKTGAELEAIEAADEVATADSNNDDRNTLKQDDTEKVTKEEELLEMLYRPLALRTNAQKRIQILLLEQLIREMKISFNKKFDDCFATKEEKFDEIRTKNNRMKEILNELKIQEDYFKPTWKDSEFPEKVVTVTDEEIPVAKYISEAERKKLAEEEAERKRKAAMDQGDNAPERALMEMMGGTLEQEQGLNALEQELVREEWMDELLFEEMSEEQKKMLEDFESRQKALLEEKEKYRKGLELELKKIKQDISDICKGVDEKISSLLELKMATQMQIHVQELYSLRLVLVIMEEEDDKKELKKIRNEMKTLTIARDNALKEYTNYSNMINGKRAIIDNMKLKEKELEKSFKKTMQDMSPGGAINTDTLATLSSLYRTRNTSNDNINDGADATRNSLFTGASSTGVSGDVLNEIRSKLEEEGRAMLETSPFYSAQIINASKDPNIAKEKERSNQMQPLDLENDVPEGFECPIEMLQKLQELRMLRIEHELNIKFLSNDIDVMVMKETQLNNVVHTMNNELTELNAHRSEMNERIKLGSSNIEVIVKTKQGRDEVKQEAVVTDYSEALVVPEQIISELNAKIRELGEGKMEGKFIISTILIKLFSL
jgi:cilia- and flagella-associated protein 43